MVELLLVVEVLPVVELLLELPLPVVGVLVVEPELVGVGEKLDMLLLGTGLMTGFGGGGGGGGEAELG